MAPPAAPHRARHAVVIGAFSNIGSAVASELLGRGWTVATMTNRPARPGDDPRIARHPLRFDAATMRTAMDGADAFVNTYWIRFPHGGTTFDHAVVNSMALITAARQAGIGRFVQVSVSNASADSPLAYYRGKADVDAALRASGMSHAIVRPTLVVGPDDVLSNNIAWFLRRFPLVAVPRGGRHELQPVTRTDTARIVADAVESGGELDVDAAGAERYSFRGYVELLAEVVGRQPRLVAVPPTLLVAVLRGMGVLLRDTVLTREELAGLEQGMLVSHEPPLGRESVAAWLREHGDAFGRHYANDTVERFARAPQSGT